MQKTFGGLVAALLLGLVLTPAARADRPAPCAPDILFPGDSCPVDVGAAVAQCCPCDDAQFSNHGRYVRCVAHAANALRRADCLDSAARRSIRKCAAKSTCSKPHDSVTCCFAFDGVCGDGGFCAGEDEELPCTPETAATDCPARIRCTIKPDAQRCLDRGGTPGTGSCCDAVCGD